SPPWPPGWTEGWPPKSCSPGGATALRPERAADHTDRSPIDIRTRRFGPQRIRPSSTLNETRELHACPQIDRREPRPPASSSAAAPAPRAATPPPRRRGG